MPAYVLANVDVKDPLRYEDYKRLVLGTLGPFGGRFLVRGAAPEVLEGTWQPHRVVILEFPSADAARAWWESPAYSTARAIRQATSEGTLILLDGAPPQSSQS